MPAGRHQFPIALFLLGIALGPLRAEPRVIARWSFEPDRPGANQVTGGPAAVVKGAIAAPGREGGALAFQDWSTVDYLNPDPRKATRVVVSPPTSAVEGKPDPLTPSYPFRVTAWIYPTADPVYYGGIVEKGLGYGASYRLVLLRGLRVSATLGVAGARVRGETPLKLNTWHEIGLAADGKTLSLWVDGTRVAQAPIPEGMPPRAADPLVIGDRFTGRIDEVTLTAE